MKQLGFTIKNTKLDFLSYLVETKDVIELQHHGAKRRARGRRETSNLWTILLLFLCPPIGIVLVWRKAWSGSTRAMLTVAPILAMTLVLLLIPSGNSQEAGGIELVGLERDVEVYGPALPTAMVEGYTSSLTNGSVFADAEDEDIQYVYAAKGAECYHLYECKFAYASSQKLTVYEAHYLGYKPCARCNPPVYSEN